MSPSLCVAIRLFVRTVASRLALDYELSKVASIVCPALHAVLAIHLHLRYVKHVTLLFF